MKNNSPLTNKTNTKETFLTLNSYINQNDQKEILCCYLKTDANKKTQ